jgi:hypothetical protein
LDVAGFTALSAQQLPPSFLNHVASARWIQQTSQSRVCMLKPVRGTSQYNVPGAIHECSTWSMIGAIDESRVAEIRIAMLL